MKLKLREKFVYGFLFFSLLIFLIFLFYTILTYLNVLKYEEEKISIYIKFASSNIVREIRQIVNEAKKLVSEDNIIRGVKSKKLSFSFYSNYKFLIYDSKGNVFIKYPFNWGINVDKKILSDFSYLITQWKKDFIIDDKKVENNNFTILTLPILSNNEIMAFLSLFIEPKEKEQELFYAILDPDIFDWEIILANKSGEVLFHSHKSLEQIEKENYSLYPPIKEAIFGKSGLSIIKIDGKNWYTLSDIIPISHWLLIISVPQSLIIKKVIKVILPPFILLTILILILLILVWIWANSLLQSFLFLTKAFKEYGEKGQKVYFENTGYPEIEDAVKNFNRMIEERRKLDTEFLEIIEKDRRNIGKSLHEELENNISKMHQLVLMVKEELSRVLVKESTFVLSYLDKINTILNKTMFSISLIADGLSPAVKDKDFATILLERIKEIEKSYEVEIVLNVNDNKVLEEKNKLIIYYIIEEALLNIIRENKATIIAITLSFELNALLIKLKHNGLIYNKEESGLRLFYYFLRLINGEVTKSKEENSLMIKIFL